MRWRSWLAVLLGGTAVVAAFVAWERPPPAVATLLFCQVPILVVLGYLVLSIRRTSDRLSQLGASLRSGERAREAGDSAIRKQLAELAAQGSSDARALGDRVIQALGKSIQTTNRKTFRQLEALTNLNSILPFDRPMPATRGWAASPDLLLLLVDLVRHIRPRLIVECGSGTSTLWFARALHHYGVDGRVVALEHEKKYAEQTRRLLEDHDLPGLVDIREAPLEGFELAGVSWQWYAASAWHNLNDIDLLFVDGPPARTAPKARFPALPLLINLLARQAVVVVDDLARPDEREIVDDWAAMYPEFWVEKVPLEAGGAVLRRGDRDLAARGPAHE